MPIPEVNAWGERENHGEPVRETVGPTREEYNPTERSGSGFHLIAPEHLTFGQGAPPAQESPFGLLNDRRKNDGPTLFNTHERLHERHTAGGSDSESRVDKFLEQAYRYAERFGGTPQEVNRRAWEYLQEIRMTQNPNDVDLAAAEHYAYARYDVSTGGVSHAVFEAVAVPTYEGAKIFGLGKLFQETSAPTSRPTIESIEYGWKGAYDGLKDYLTSPSPEPIRSPKPVNRPWSIP